MSFSCASTPIFFSEQIGEHLSFTYTDREAALNFPSHEGANVPSASSQHPAAPFGIDTSPTIPPRRHSARHREPGHIPRPRNAFIFFRSWYVDSMRASKEVQQHELSKQAGKVWKNMSDEEKKPFLRFAAIEKQEHYAMYPDYVYSPSAKVGAKSAAVKSRGSYEFSAYDVSRMASPSDTMDISFSIASWYHTEEEEFHNIKQEAPSPFHAHLDYVPSQAAYLQHAHDLVPSYIPTLPCTSDGLFSQSPEIMQFGISASFSSQRTDAGHPTASSLTCDNPYPSADYLALMKHTMSERKLEGNNLMQQYIDEVLAETAANFVGKDDA
ncbi:Transcription factor SOX-11 [Psilocybe cubensis]|uniref:Transcription factor SOX-11 n=2 Tax=Psilocybe cubensis TaxID=181762 RepID=A0ACB8GQM4_PSICU|nr:Transcription factor SOX-11 [Psilocybe cubensis]KAH9477938.1 Transcription factor SOX-11 [Psilocybe cubensis]